MKEVTMCCTSCPKGCALITTIDDEGRFVSVTGNSCPRGEAFAETEWVNPVRMLTSTVFAEINGKNRLVPVKTKEPIAKSLMAKAMEEIKGIVLDHPVRMGDVILENIACSGSALVACKDVEG